MRQVWVIDWHEIPAKDMRSGGVFEDFCYDNELIRGSYYPCKQFEYFEADLAAGISDPDDKLDAEINARRAIWLRDFTGFEKLDDVYIFINL